MVEITMLETAQIFDNHPVLQETTRYKIKYLNTLEYFVRKYSAKDSWSAEALQLYIRKFLGSKAETYTYDDFHLKKDASDVLAVKFKAFRFYSYRYSFLIDCLFICAYADQDKGEAILQELETFFLFFNKRDSKKSQQILSFLYQCDSNTASIRNILQINYAVSCWDRNRKYIAQKPIRVLVTANMSAGKSTLINAMIGKKVNRTQNESCTAKIHRIVNKPFEDGFCYTYTDGLNLNAADEEIMQADQCLPGTEVMAGTHFRMTGMPSRRIWFIDTPGVNSSQDTEEKNLTEHTICHEEVDQLIYVMNGENIGSTDDRKHLLFLLEHYHGNILFLVNKLDHFRKEDSVLETLSAVQSDLSSMGFENPIVVPGSSYAAYLAKRKKFGEVLNEEEEEEYQRLMRKLSKTEYQFNTYYPRWAQQIVHGAADPTTDPVLRHSGILELEVMIATGGN